jgi:ion channel-forming bestrophin family protein
VYNKLGWTTIPATLLAAYIIIGMAVIGRQIENPFGEEVNDLPLEYFCDNIAADLDIITSTAAPKPSDFMKKDSNMLLYPLSGQGYNAWAMRSEEEIREALRDKVNLDFEMKQGRPLAEAAKGIGRGKADAV